MPISPLRAVYGEIEAHDDGGDKLKSRHEPHAARASCIARRSLAIA
ncbi:MAG TPA: hypothetical protein VME69_13105 [Methylocella sp.]|nr:hypothetical protein [Methylocella sp.]